MPQCLSRDCNHCNPIEEKPKVTIRSITEDRSKWGDYLESVEVYVDGVSIGDGHYGGEPEDNMRGRTYDWVEGLIQNVAEACGAEVTVENVEKPFEED